MAERKEAQEELPTEVLQDVAWTFEGDKFATQAEFSAAARQHQIDVTDEDSWQPGEVVLSCPRVKIEYWGVVAPEDAEYSRLIVELQSDNREFFTAEELLFKLHNAVIDQLQEVDHIYFEGLTLKQQSTNEDPVPLYEMHQGS